MTDGHSNSEEGIQTLEEDTVVRFVTFEEGQIPIFTSTNRIFDKGIIKEEATLYEFKRSGLIWSCERSNIYPKPLF